MNGWLLDSNILSELRRPKPNERVVSFIESQPLELLHVGVVTFAEFGSASNGLKMPAEDPK